MIPSRYLRRRRRQPRQNGSSNACWTLGTDPPTGNDYARWAIYARLRPPLPHRRPRPRLHHLPAAARRTRHLATHAHPRRHPRRSEHHDPGSATSPTSAPAGTSTATIPSPRSAAATAPRRRQAARDELTQHDDAYASNHDTRKAALPVPAAPTTPARHRPRPRRSPPQPQPRFMRRLVAQCWIVSDKIGKHVRSTPTTSPTTSTKAASTRSGRPEGNPCLCLSRRLRSRPEAPFRPLPGPLPRSHRTRPAGTHTFATKTDAEPLARSAPKAMIINGTWRDPELGRIALGPHLTDLDRTPVRPAPDEPRSLPLARRPVHRAVAPRHACAAHHTGGGSRLAC